MFELLGIIYLSLLSSSYQIQPRSLPSNSDLNSVTKCDLPTPAMDDHRSHQIKKYSSKYSKTFNVTSKKSTTSYEHRAVVVDGRHKRVWKACERCRMKKTKVRRYSTSMLLDARLSNIILV